jgi:endonuclease/exonuclease/phosphatase family metal-dependent hydrolase
VRAIRVVTINIWSDNGDVDRRMKVLIPQLRALQPNVVCMQEVREAPGGLQQAQLVARALEADFRFAVVDPNSPGGPIGNAIVSTVPILDASSLTLPTPLGDLRAAIRCELQTPHGVLAVTSAHLTYELDASPSREMQALALDEFSRAKTGALPPVLTGDLNCTPDSDVMRFFTGRASIQGRGTYWRDAYHRRHPDSNGFTWSSRNHYARRSVERDRRIDYVLVGPMNDRGPGSVLHSRVVLDLPAPNEVYASDHFGVFAEISLIPPEGDAW